MNNAPTVLLILAAVLFAVEGVGLLREDKKVSVIGLGLFCWVLSILFTK